MFFVALVSTADVVLMADGNPIRAMNLNCKHFIIFIYSSKHLASPFPIDIFKIDFKYLVIVQGNYCAQSRIGWRNIHDFYILYGR